MNTQPSEDALNFMESHIPELAEAAFKQAYWKTLADGVSVMIAENNHLVEVFPDGSKRIIRALAQINKPENQN